MSLKERRQNISSKNVVEGKERKHTESRIHFALNCGAMSCPPLRIYDGRYVQNQLTVATKEYLETDEGILVDVANNTIKLSKLFDWYEVDFGDSNEEIVSWVLNYLEEPQKKEQLEKILRKGGFQLSH